MESTYLLQVGYFPEMKNKISSILELEPNTLRDLWSYELVTNENGTDYINNLLDILENKYEQLESIGVTKEQITLWFYYNYEFQCNMEFEPEHLKRMGVNGIKLCITCYDVGDEEDYKNV